jgi:hypothetical protein
MKVLREDVHNSGSMFLIQLSTHSPPRSLVALVLAALSGLAPSATRAQSANPSNAECKAVDVDASFASIRTLDHHESLILQLRNDSQTACILRGGGPGSIFLNVTLGPAGSYAGTNIWTHECLGCEADGKPNQERYDRVLALQPGDEAYKTYRWATESSDPKSPCVAADGMYTTVNSDAQRTLEVVSPLLITQVCSDIQVSAYRSGRFGVGERAAAGGQADDRNLHLTTDKANNLLGELIVLHISADARGPLDKDSCPILFFRVRSEEGATRFVQNVQYHGCKTEASGADGRKAATEDLIFNNPFSMYEPGDYSLTLSEFTGRTEAGRALMVTSPPLILHFTDASTLKREWAPQVRGLSIAVNLDQDVYELGQDVHLHAVAEDFDATPTIYRSDCERSVTFEVRDAGGHVVKQKNPVTPGYPSMLFVSCHAGMSFPFPKRKPFPIETSLREWGILPDDTGEYTVVATWNALSESLKPPPSNALGRWLEPYAVVRSQPAKFRITDQKNVAVQGARTRYSH